MVEKAKDWDHTDCPDLKQQLNKWIKAQGKGDNLTIYEMLVDLPYTCDTTFCTAYGAGYYIKAFDHDDPAYSKKNQKYLVYHFNLSAARKAGGMHQGGKLELADANYAEDEEDVDAFKSPAWAGSAPASAGHKRSRRSEESNVSMDSGEFLSTDEGDA